MSDFFQRRGTSVVAAIALLVFVLASLLGGPGATTDINLLRALAEQRAAHSGLTSFAIPLTIASGAPGMLAIALLTIGILAFLRRWKQAASFAAIVIGGRLAVEMLKLLVDRPRPTFGPYPVEVYSLSFPRAHAANSMITLLALAMLVTPGRLRVAAVTAAIAVSGVVGLTRPYLGVHWPSDVVGGWAFGIAWVVSLAISSDYWRASRANRAV